MQLELPPLPYPEDALAPVISAETLRFHHGKHHKKYVDTANQLLAQEPVQAATLEDLVRGSTGKLFNNAAQVWNHDFYWKSLSPQPTKPEGALLKKIDEAFGGYEALTKQLATAASGQFGSGWAWLIHRAGKLEVVPTANAETPMAKGIACLLTLDVWEHAYYIDYRNDRDSYLKKVIAERLNWKFAAENLSKAK
ncbi:MAG: superoxide dismutase [Betaproteobacteria bacterium]|nr:superoxide dismutase [Betaproteobacteria bacterium]